VGMQGSYLSMLLMAAACALSTAGIFTNDFWPGVHVFFAVFGFLWLVTTLITETWGKS